MAKKQAAKKFVRQGRRTRQISVWVTPEEDAALREAETTLEARTGKTRQRSEYLRDMIKKFVSDVRLTNEFLE